MQTQCITNKLSVLPKKIQRFAFTQSEQGIVDLTEGRVYEVFGTRENKHGKFYLVLTDSIHHDLPWWMPAAFFDGLQGEIPKSWQTQVLRRFSKDSLTMHPAYFDAANDIEDGTPEGYDAFKTMRGE